MRWMVMADTDNIPRMRTLLALALLEVLDLRSGR
jgi:hypothetical protein